MPRLSIQNLSIHYTLYSIRPRPLISTYFARGISLGIDERTNRKQTELQDQDTRARIFKRLWSPGIDSKE